VELRARKLPEEDLFEEASCHAAVLQPRKSAEEAKPNGVPEGVDSRPSGYCRRKATHFHGPAKPVLSQGGVER